MERFFDAAVLVVIVLVLEAGNLPTDVAVTTNVVAGPGPGLGREFLVPFATCTAILCLISLYGFVRFCRRQ